MIRLFLHFVLNTLFLMAGNAFRNTAAAYALAALPIISVPIQDVQLFDYAVAHKSVNASYGLQANNDETYIIGKDPYTSDQQRSRDQNDQKVSIYDRDWSDTKSLQNAGTETSWISASTKTNKNGKYLDYDLIHITPDTWQIGTFEIIEANGDKVEVEAIRPKTWFAENNVNAINDRTWFYMPEIGINGEATLLTIRPTVINTTNLALNESGLSRSVSIGHMVDRPVITTFKRNAPVVYDYYFSDGAVIGATPEHPFFSVDRNNYIAVGELQLGEQVMTAGEKVVKFLAGKQRDKGEPVYNFEVWREHNYYVGDRAIFDDSQNGSPKATSKRVNREAVSAYSGEFLLVHNTCPWEAIRDLIKDATLRIKKINGSLEIPTDWEKIDVLRDGKVVGSRYVDPKNNKIQIRLHDKGDLAHFPHNYNKPYGRYELGKDANGKMRHADINGNIVESGDPKYYEKTHFLINAVDVE
ncbi:MAG TPA: Hint domain-containing protein [Saprospiraceae bacterium]|nr:Hint domain-containing protein [Saprospiraceae bacterium]